MLTRQYFFASSLGVKKLRGIWKTEEKILRRTNWILTVGLLWLLPASGASAKSICYGTPSRGRLEAGERLPLKGENFSSYSLLGYTLGRTTVHDRVKAVIVKTYEELYSHLPDKTFVYGETGWPEGGSIKPHKTHQNGLSVDFMVPVVDSRGKSVALPTHLLNKWGYGIEFDKAGKYKDYTIDFEALAAHLFYLDQVARQMGVGIRRVIFDPDLRPHLTKTKYWKDLSGHLRFSKHRSWVRHDEHYHVDFEVPCKPL